MTKMHAIAARSTTGVQEERLPLLVPVQYFIKFARIVLIKFEFLMYPVTRGIPVRKEQASPEEHMWTMSSQSFKAFQ